MIKHIIYLHGFASSPLSTKAQLFGKYLADYPDVSFHVPDLNAPSFEKLTLSAMVEATANTVKECNEGDIYLIGSSLGGLTAIHFLNRYRDSLAQKIHGAILLAPALDFMDNRTRQLGDDGLKQWKSDGYLPVHHYATNRVHHVHYGLVEDIAQYDSYSVKIDQPITIFHGMKDESVNYRQSLRFSEKYPNVTLFLSDSDHHLYDQVDDIWRQIRKFIERK